MSIILDTNFIVSFLLEDSDTHERATKIVDRGVLNGEKLYITNNIIDEVITILGNKTKDIAKVNNAYIWLRDVSTLINEYEEIPNFNEKALNEYYLYNTQLSFTDASLVLIAKELGINSIITFDRKFRRVKDVNIISK